MDIQADSTQNAVFYVISQKIKIKCKAKNDTLAEQWIESLKKVMSEQEDFLNVDRFKSKNIAVMNRSNDALLTDFLPVYERR